MARRNPTDLSVGNRISLIEPGTSRRGAAQERCPRARKPVRQRAAPALMMRWWRRSEWSDRIARAMRCAKSARQTNNSSKLTKTPAIKPLEPSIVDDKGDDGAERDTTEASNARRHSSVRSRDPLWVLLRSVNLVTWSEGGEMRGRRPLRSTGSENSRRRKQSNLRWTSAPDERLAS